MARAGWRIKNLSVVKRVIVIGIVLILMVGIGYVALLFYSASRSNSIPPIRR